MRPLSYPDSHGIAICFAMDDPTSLENVIDIVSFHSSDLPFTDSTRGTLTNRPQWYPEIDRFCKGVPIFLIGCKQDLRHDPNTIDGLLKVSERPVTTEDVWWPLSAACPMSTNSLSRHSKSPAWSTLHCTWRLQQRPASASRNSWKSWPRSFRG